LIHHGLSLTQQPRETDDLFFSELRRPYFSFHKLDLLHFSRISRTLFQKQQFLGAKISHTGVYQDLNIYLLFSYTKCWNASEFKF